MHDADFLLPFSNAIIRKGGEGEDKDEWVVYIEASNEFRDHEDEVVMQKAMENALDEFMKVGQISWDHMHKDPVRSRPRYIIGHPLDVKFSQDGNRNSTLVKAQLYHENKLAQDLKDNLDSGADRLGASIGGKKLSKSFSGRIDRLYWDEVAITYKPVNSSTMGNVTQTPMAEFVKSFAPDFVKALTAGAGINPEEFTGGRAMTRERGQKRDIENGLSEHVQREFKWAKEWGLNDAIREVVQKKFKAAFKAALLYIRDNEDYTDDSLVDHLVSKKFTKKVAEDVCEYLKTNMNKALHVLR